MTSVIKKSTISWNWFINKKCQNCFKVSKFPSDASIPLPSQKCPYCGYEMF